MPHPLQQLRETLVGPETGVLAALREQQLLASPDIEKTQLLAADDLVRDFPSVLLHLDPQRPHDVAESRVGGLYANDAVVNTEGSPPYLSSEMSGSGTRQLIVEQVDLCVS